MNTSMILELRCPSCGREVRLFNFADGDGMRYGAHLYRRSVDRPVVCPGSYDTVKTK